MVLNNPTSKLIPSLLGGSFPPGRPQRSGQSKDASVHTRELPTDNSAQGLYKKSISLVFLNIMPQPFLALITLLIKVQANGLLLRPNGNSQFSSNSAKQSFSSENVSTPYSQISGISSYDYEDDFTSEDEHSDFSAMTNVSRRTDKSSKIPIKRSSSLRRRPDLVALGTSGPPTPSPKGSSSPKLAPAASPTLPPSSPPAPVPEPKPEEGEDLLMLTDPEVFHSSEIFYGASDCEKK